MSIYSTYAMLAAIRQMQPATSFLRDRYFPMDGVFTQEEVIVDIQASNGQKLAPVVLPRKDSITVERDAFNTRKLVPPLVAPSRTITLEDTTHRIIGENPADGQSPEQRAAELLAQDIADLSGMITAREEQIAAACIFNNGYTLRQYADKYGEGEFKEFDLHFYDGDANPAEYHPGAMWDAEGSNITGDLYQMILMLTHNSNAATDILLGADVASVLLEDETILRLLDTNNYRFGQIDPVELGDFAARLGTINIRGHKVNLLTYDATHVDEVTGKVVPYIPANKVAVTAPNAGCIRYGAVTQTEHGSEQIQTIPASRVPRTWIEKQGRELRIASRPLLAPRSQNPFISATVLA